MKFRTLNKWYANLFGYFWLPCHICGQYFGGHEWIYLDQHAVDPKTQKDMGICQDCYIYNRLNKEEGGK